MFRYSNLQMEQKSSKDMSLRVRVINSGRRRGTEVVQLYLGSSPAVEEPPQQLNGFQKVFLKPGESKIVTMELNRDALTAWDPVSHGWKVYPGAYSVMIGSASRDIRSKGAFAIK